MENSHRHGVFVLEGRSHPETMNKGNLRKIESQNYQVFGKLKYCVENTSWEIMQDTEIKGIQTTPICRTHNTIH